MRVAEAGADRGVDLVPGFLHPPAAHAERAQARKRGLAQVLPVHGVPLPPAEARAGEQGVSAAVAWTPFWVRNARSASVASA